MMQRRTPIVVLVVAVLLVPALSAGADRGPKEKVEVCHVPPGNPGEAHTITVGGPALQAHLAHGDDEGACDVERPGRNGGVDKDDSNDGNRRPVARAGGDRCVVFGGQVELDGTDSFDPDGDDDDLVFDWDVVSRPPESTLDDGDLSPDDDDDDPIFTPDQFGVFRFALEVNDLDGSSDTDTVEIEVHMNVELDEDDYDVDEGETTPVVITLNEDAPRDVTVALKIDEPDEAVVILDEDDEEDDAIDQVVIDEGDDTVTVYLLGAEDDDSGNESTTLTVSVGNRDCGDTETARIDIDDDDQQPLSLVDQLMVFFRRLLIIWF
jgi:hypothetical protein